MSEPESLDISAEDLMPAWVSGLENAPSLSPPARSDKESSYEDQRRGKGQGNRGGRKFDRDGGGGGGGFRKDDRRQSGGRNDRRDRGRGSRDHRGEDRQPRRAEDIIPEVDFVVEPTAEAVKALAKHIRSTNRAYAMAEVARMVLAAADRYRVIFRVKSGKQDAAKGKAAQNRPSPSFRMVRCKTDGSVWLSREEAVAHFLNTPELLKEFYEMEEVTTEAPKGNFSVIAVCGLSGTILGPPNHHEYQQNIAALHRERFGNMPLERFKSRIEMRRDEETVEQWKEQKSTAKHYRVKTEKPEVVANKQTPEETTDPVVEASDGEEGKLEIPSTENAPAEDSEMAEESSSGDSSVEAASETSGDSTEAENVVTAGEQKSESEDEAVSIDATENEFAPSEEGEPAEEGESDQSETPSPEEEAGPAITSMTELTRHFREHFARRIFKEVGEARLPGTASKKELSPALIERMNAEINWQKRGFPLPMVRTLCRRFEHQGLKFFKRGAKELFVSAARPRALAQDTVLTDRLLVMLNFIKDKPGTLAGDLIKYMQGDVASKDSEPSKKKGAESDADNKQSEKVPSEPTKSELALLADLRWLLAEGYLIEFPNSELLPGTAVSADKRKRRPSQRSKKKRPAKKKQELAGSVSGKKPVQPPAEQVSAATDSPAAEPPAEQAAPVTDSSAAEPPAEQAAPATDSPAAEPPAESAAPESPQK